MEKTTRSYLQQGDIIRCQTGHIYTIKGIIARGGTAILYEASREGTYVNYVLKELAISFDSKHNQFVRSNGILIPESILGDQKKIEIQKKEYEKLYRKELLNGQRIASAVNEIICFSEIEEIISINDDYTVFEEGSPTLIGVMGQFRNKGLFLSELVDCYSESISNTNKKVLSLEYTIRCIQELLKTLNNVHEKGKYLHLDLHPSNVYYSCVDPNKDFILGSCFLLDFGSSVPLKEGGKSGELIADQIFTTQGFSAPELFLRMNSGNDTAGKTNESDGLILTIATDIYSVGRIFLYLLTGESDSSNNTITWSDLLKICPKLDQKTGSGKEKVLHTIKKIVRTSTAVNPNERYSSLQEMYIALNELCESIGLSIENHISYNFFEQNRLLKQQYINDRKEKNSLNNRPLGYQKIELIPNSCRRIIFTEATGRKLEVSLKEYMNRSWRSNRPNHILFHGVGGVGKTTSILSFDEEDFLPFEDVPLVFFPLHALNGAKMGEKTDSIKWLLETNKNFSEETILHIYKLADKQWNGPSIVFLLDGLNEVDLEEYGQLIDSIIKWSKKSGVQIITTSRFATSLGSNFQNVTLTTLNTQEVSDILRTNNEEPITELDLLNTPLTLNLYLNTKNTLKNFKGGSYPFTVWKPSTSKVNIIWNYLQSELIKSTSYYGDIPLSEYVYSLLFVAPYICYSMMKQNTFVISESDLTIRIEEALEYYESFLHVPPTPLKMISYVRYGNRALSPYLYDGEKFRLRVTEKQHKWQLEIITHYCQIFYPSHTIYGENYFGLIHQDFINCLAAIHFCNITINYNSNVNYFMASENKEINHSNLSYRNSYQLVSQGILSDKWGDLYDGIPFEWKAPINDQIIRDVVDYLGNDGIREYWDKAKIQQQIAPILINNMLSLAGKNNEKCGKPANDFRDYDFSGLSLENIWLANESPVKDMLLPKKSNQLVFTLLSYRTFKNSQSQRIVRAISYKNGHYLVTLDGDGALSIWNVNIKQKIYNLKLESDNIKQEDAIQFLSDNEVAITHTNLVEIIELGEYTIEGKQYYPISSNRSFITYDEKNIYIALFNSEIMTQSFSGESEHVLLEPMVVIEKLWIGQKYSFALIYNPRPNDYSEVHEAKLYEKGTYKELGGIKGLSRSKLFDIQFDKYNEMKGIVIYDSDYVFPPIIYYSFCNNGIIKENQLILQPEDSEVESIHFVDESTVIFATHESLNLWNVSTGERNTLVHSFNDEFHIKYGKIKRKKGLDSKDNYAAICFEKCLVVYHLISKELVNKIITETPIISFDFISGNRLLVYEKAGNISIWNYLEDIDIYDEIYVDLQGERSPGYNNRSNTSYLCVNDHVQLAKVIKGGVGISVRSKIIYYDYADNTIKNIVRCNTEIIDFDITDNMTAILSSSGWIFLKIGDSWNEKRALNWRFYQLFPKKIVLLQDKDMVLLFDEHWLQTWNYKEDTIKTYEFMMQGEYANSIIISDDNKYALISTSLSQNMFVCSIIIYDLIELKPIKTIPFEDGVWGPVTGLYCYKNSALLQNGTNIVWEIKDYKDENAEINQVGRFKTIGEIVCLFNDDAIVTKKHNNIDDGFSLVVYKRGKNEVFPHHEFVNVEADKIVGWSSPNIFIGITCDGDIYKYDIKKKQESYVTTVLTSIDVIDMDLSSSVLVYQNQADLVKLEKTLRNNGAILPEDS